MFLANCRILQMLIMKAQVAVQANSSITHLQRQVLTVITSLCKGLSLSARRRKIKNVKTAREFFFGLRKILTRRSVEFQRDQRKLLIVLGPRLENSYFTRKGSFRISKVLRSKICLLIAL